MQCTFLQTNDMFKLFISLWSCDVRCWPLAQQSHSTSFPENHVTCHVEMPNTIGMLQLFAEALTANIIPWQLRWKKASEV